MRVLLLFVLLSCRAMVSSAQQEKFTIYFAFNRAEISAAEAGRLDSFVQSTQKVSMSVSGHTDSHGSNAYNDALSQRRADAVKNYLIADGFSVSDEHAFGETKLMIVDGGDTIKGAVNRRVEVYFELPAQAATQTDTARPVTHERLISDVLADKATAKGSTLVLRNLNFVGGMHRILPSSKPELQSLLEAMQANPKLKISIEGHICCLPGNQDGLDYETHVEDLSMQRAKAVYEYLVGSGIPEKRLRYKGFGHSVPLYPFPENNSDEQVANRRVEIRILEK